MYSIFESIKQFFVVFGLKIVRSLVYAKPYVLSSIKRIFSPLSHVGQFFISAIFVPAYRILFLVKRRLNKVYRPAKNKLMFFVTNRYSLHAVLIVLISFTAFINIRTENVRAETFGERSLMYDLISQTDIEIIEEYAIDPTTIAYSSIAYRENTSLSSFDRGIDFIVGEESQTSLLGGGIISAPTISEGADSIAPRQDIETYLVQNGDTLSIIAEQFGISLNTLLWANGLSVRSVLKPGSTLTISPTSGVIHQVKSGDTLSEIANKYDAGEDTILAFNRLASADDLVVGEQIVVPGGAIKAVVPSRSSAFGSILTSPTTKTPVTTSTISPTTVGSGSMVWPTDLRVITQYYGWRHTGVDIDCYYNNDNYASDYGVVQFSGWKGGYGNAVEINHGNGIVTRYAHNASNYVVAGQQVAKGQAIARCGTTGRSTGTHIHFEVIVNGGFRNPLEYVR